MKAYGERRYSSIIRDLSTRCRVSGQLHASADLRTGKPSLVPIG
jgi:hypothetical protein